MFIVLLLLPFLVFLSVIYMYRFSGKKNFLNFDLVQFLFIFVVYPLCYIWIKRFAFYLIQRELGVTVSVNEWFWIDTGITISFLYFYAFGVIHALTKTFSLRLERDPLFDMLTHSTYFHEFLSHVGMYSLILMAIAFIGLLNVAFPLTFLVDKKTMWGLLVLAMVSGIFGYFAFFGLTDKGFKYSTYKKLIRLTYGMCFVSLASASMLFSVAFSSAYLIFWIILFCFASLIISTFFINPSRRIYKVFEHLRLTSGVD